MPGKRPGGLCPEIFVHSSDNLSTHKGMAMAKKKALVVDDEASFREMVAWMLKKEGYDIVEADNGLSAFELAKANVPDLIVSDVMMYSGSGFILREFLKRDPVTATIPLILMSGAAQSAGAWGAEEELEYLQKPFSHEDLIAAIKRLLKSRPSKR